MKLSLTLALLGSLGLTGCGSSAGLAQESKNPASVLVPFEEIAFHRPIPIVAPEMAALWGDRSVGASGNEEKQPAGKVSALHVHPNDTYAMVIEGRMTHAFEGGPAAVELGPGSFYTLPAGAPHVSACLEGSECLIVYWQPGKLGYEEVKTGNHGSVAPGIARPAASIQLAPAGAGALPTALLWGDPTKGRTGALEGQEPGAEAPARTYAGDVHGVVITGRESLSIGGGARRTVGPGSYYVVKAGAALAMRCEGPEACRTLVFHPEPAAPARAEDR
ncbi:MAG: cupin domain-containing protein [Byssovorax sp.]